MDGSARSRSQDGGSSERMKGRVVVESGLSEGFPVNFGLRQGSAFSPLLFVIVMELVSRKISTKDVLRK